MNKECPHMSQLYDRSMNVPVALLDDVSELAMR